MPTPHFAAALAALVFACAAGQPARAAESRWTVTIQSQVAGHLSETDDGAGHHRTDFSYRDNGRGPDIAETWTVGADGIVTAYEAKGQSTYGNEIRERFARRDGAIEWDSLVDRGSRPAAPEAVYLPVENSPAWNAEMLRAIWRRADHAAPGFPTGRLSVEHVDTLTVRGADGREARAGLYALSGLGITPEYLWLREDADLALFALVEPWVELVAEGFESGAATLLARQQRAQSEHLAALAKQLARPLPGLTVIRNVRWFDSQAARMRGPADVCLYGGRIASILPAGQGPRDAEQSIDGSGRTLLPGLFDMHAHMWRDGALLHLAAGVTSTRDPGNVNADLAAMMRDYERGTELGPRIVPLGFVEGKSPFSAKLGIVAASLDEAKAAVDWYAARGYRQIKLYNSIKPEWVKPVAAHAHALGLRVGGHVPAFMRAEQAVRDGYDELTHANQLMLNFLVKPDDDTRTLLRFSLVAEKGAGVDLDGPRVAAFVKLLKDRGTVVDPTLSTFEGMFNQLNGELAPNLAAVADHLPPTWQRGLRSAQSDIDEAKAPRYRQSFKTMQGLIARLYRAGVPLVAGTDDMPGFILHRELEQYVAAGIPAPEVLRIATWNGARFTGTLADRGSIERGKLADLVLVDGDPAARIEDIRRVSLVFLGGTAIAPAAVHEALGIQPFVAAPRIEVRAQ